MNCPRCTQPTPTGAGFCPACGLDLSLLPPERESPTALGTSAETPASPVGEATAFEGGAPSAWPRVLRLHGTRETKRPFVAATLAFFFGPFSYLYLEQANWFWWSLLGGFVLLLVSRGEALPLLLAGFVLHAYDVALILNDELRAGQRQPPLPGGDTV